MIPITAYTTKSLTELQTMKTQADAEMTRQLVAGGSFAQPGGRSRSGVMFANLAEHVSAIDYAISLLNGTRTEVTVADCSAPPL